MDYKEKAQHLAETIAGLGFTTASESAARSALTEAHAAGLAEGEAKNQELDRANHLLSQGMRSEKSAREEAEDKLAALTAERDAANDEARQMQERLTRVVEGHKALTAENQRMRDALMKIMIWWPTVSYARMTLLIDPVQVCREALSPSEKPAPEVKPVSQGYTACKAKDPTPRTPWLHAMGGHVCAKDKGHSGYHACCGGHCSHVWYSKKTAQDAGDGKGEGA